MESGPTAQGLFLSISKTSDPLTQVQLHPLVILTISDYITRHVARQQTGPIAGAVIGSQNGRDITMEHAFECKLVERDNGIWMMDEEWFTERLQQYKDVHKANSLDLVGWFTLTTPSGPAPNHLHIHEHLLAHHNDSTLLLAFHPSIAADAASRNGKLPLSVYESHYETASNAPDNHDKAMRDAATSTTEASSEVLPKIRFRQLPYTIETGEAEMIAVDFVARGGANATAIRDAAPSAPRAPRPTSAAGSDDVAQSKGKPRAKSSDASDALGSAAPAAVHVTPLMLSTEDDDAIASLMARANAVRMLRQRLALMRAYVASLPPGYLTEPDAAPPHRMAPDTRVSHPVLRSIASLLARLPLLSLECAPADGNVPAAAAIPPTTLQERDAAAADAALVGLLGAMGGTLRGATEMGQRAGIVEAARTNPSMSSGRGSGFMPLVGAGGAAGRDPGTPVYS